MFTVYFYGKVSAVLPPYLERTAHGEKTDEVFIIDNSLLIACAGTALCRQRR
jgi:hypothetical protein